MGLPKLWPTLVRYHTLAVGLFGIVAIAIVSRPGTGAFVAGPLRFDAFYVAIGAFGALVLLSLSDPSDADEHDFRRSDAEE